ncbi:hypothetical protein [Dialister invisus]|uniref:hypothetical protein n=1 Tax=Dialister invisus TaxID=218538 RepID=UPI00307BA643
MKNKSLKTIFHRDDTLVDSVYNDRFNNPYSIKLGIRTKETADDYSYEMFTCLTPEMMLLSQKINDLTLKLGRCNKPYPTYCCQTVFHSLLKRW